MASVKGLTVGFDADTTKFNKNVKKMNKQIKTTQSEVYNLSKSLKFKWDSAKFIQAQKKAQQALKQTQAKSESLRERLKYLDETGADKNTAGYRNLEAQLIKTEREAVEMKAKLKEINNLKIENLAKKFETVGASITKAGQAMTPISAAAAAIVAGFAKIGMSAVTAGDYIGTTAQQLNLSTKELQEWLYIADQTDVDSAQFVNAVTKMQSALSHLSVGEEDITATALKEMGITAEEAANGMGANFGKIINNLAEMKDATEQAYYANEIFGTRMGSKMIPLLNNGAEGLSELSAEFEELGYISDDDVQSLDAFEDVMDKLKYQFGLIKNQIGIALMPLMEKLADVTQTKIIPAFQKLEEKFSSLNEKQIETGLKTLAFVASLAPVLLMMGKLTSGIGGIIKIIPKLISGLSLLAAHPIILIIVAVIGLLVYLYKTNEEFRTSIQNLVKTLSGSLKPIITSIGHLLKTLFTIIQPIINIIVKIVNVLIKLLVPAIEFVAKIISKVVIAYIDTLSKVYIGIYNMIIKTINGIVNFAETALNGVIDFINNIISQINKLGDVLGFTIGKLDNVEFNAKVLKEYAEPEDIGEIEIASTPTVNSKDNDILSKYDLETSPSTVINNDYSDKDITVEITVQNYGDEVDVDNLVEQINLKLLEQI